jgi:hypothetical protein
MNRLILALCFLTIASWPAPSGDLPESPYRLKSHTLSQTACKKGKNETLCYTKRLDLIDGSILKPSLKRIVDRFNAHYKSLYDRDDPQDALSDTDPDDTIGSREWINQSSLGLYDYVEGLLTLEADFYSYVGGAHPNSAIELHLYREKDGKELELADLLGPGREKAFAGVAEKYFRLNEGLLPDEPLEDCGWIADGFVTPENLAVTERGLLALYSPYEAKAYAYGYSTWIIPYYALRPLVAPDAALAPLTRRSTPGPQKLHRVIDLAENQGRLTLDLTQKGQKVEVKTRLVPTRLHSRLWLSFSFPQALASKPLPVRDLGHRGFKRVLLYLPGIPIYSLKAKRKLPATYPLLEAECAPCPAYKTLEMRFDFEPAPGSASYCINYRVTSDDGGKIRNLIDGNALDQQGFEVGRACIDLPPQ